MEYKVLPKLKSSSVAVSHRVKKEKQDEREEKQSLLKSNRKEDSAHKEKMHSELIKANKEVSSSIDNSSENLLKAITQLSKQVGLNVEIPELVEGDKISSSIEGGSNKIEAILKTVTKAISSIELETHKPLEIAPHAKSLTAAITKNMSVLKDALSELNESINEIRLENLPQPTGWEFDVQRNEKGFINKVVANATDYMSFTDG